MSWGCYLNYSLRIGNDAVETLVAKAYAEHQQAAFKLVTDDFAYRFPNSA